MSQPLSQRRRCTFSKVSIERLQIVKYTRALTFENVWCLPRGIDIYAVSIHIVGVRVSAWAGQAFFEFAPDVGNFL